MDSDLLSNPYLYYSLTLLVAVIMFIYLFNRRKNLKPDEKNEIRYDGIIESLGGKENIVEIKNSGSRVEFQIKYKKDVDKEKIKENGINTVVMTSKKIMIG